LFKNCNVDIIESVNDKQYSAEALFGGRLQRLLQEIMGERNNKTMVFVETKRRADNLQYRLKRAG